MLRLKNYYKLRIQVDPKMCKPLRVLQKWVTCNIFLISTLTNDNIACNLSLLKTAICLKPPHADDGNFNDQRPKAFYWKKTLKCDHENFNHQQRKAIFLIKGFEGQTRDVWVWELQPSTEKWPFFLQWVNTWPWAWELQPSTEKWPFSLQWEDMWPWAWELQPSTEKNLFPYACFFFQIYRTFGIRTISFQELVKLIPTFF